MQSILGRAWARRFLTFLGSIAHNGEQKLNAVQTSDVKFALVLVILVMYMYTQRWPIRMGHIPLPCMDILRCKVHVHVHVHEPKPLIFSEVNTNGKRAAVQSQCTGQRMHRYLHRVLARMRPLVLLCDKQIFCAVNSVSCKWTCTLKHVRIPEQISLHVHDQAWFLEQWSSRPAPL